MNSRLANTVGDRINQFDNLDTQTVESFNALFPECPVKGYDLNMPLVIGSPAPNNCREITVSTTYGLIAETILHKMYSDIMYTLDRDVYNWDERDVELTEINGVPV